MHIRVGYELLYDCPQPTPMVLMLNTHPSRVADIVVPDHLTTDSAVPIHGYHDAFGNWCSRIVAPQGRVRIASTAIINDADQPDPVVASAQQHLLGINKLQAVTTAVVEVAPESLVIGTA